MGNKQQQQHTFESKIILGPNKYNKLHRTRLTWFGVNLKLFHVKPIPTKSKDPFDFSDNDGSVDTIIMSQKQDNLRGLGLGWNWLNMK